MSIPRINASDIQFAFNNGFAKTQVLAETHEYVRLYKCVLKAGQSITLGLHDDRFEVFSFVKGSGSIITPSASYSIPPDEESFFVPDFNKERVDLHAGSDLEYVLFETLHTEADKIAFEDTHMKLPYFRKLSELFRYDQSCKGANTQSYLVIPGKQLGRVLMGVVTAVGEGTDEKGHPSVHQWNYMMEGTELVADVQGEVFQMSSGDFSFVEGGLDHSHIAEPGNKCNYIWFEWYVNPETVTGHIIPQVYGKNK